MRPLTRSPTANSCSAGSVCSAGSACSAGAVCSSPFVSHAEAVTAEAEERVAVLRVRVADAATVVVASGEEEALSVGTASEGVCRLGSFTAAFGDDAVTAAEDSAAACRRRFPLIPVVAIAPVGATMASIGLEVVRRTVCVTASPAVGPEVLRETFARFFARGGTCVSSTSTSSPSSFDPAAASPIACAVVFAAAAAAAATTAAAALSAISAATSAAASRATVAIAVLARTIYSSA
jgi:hypothetical protein